MNDDYERLQLQTKKKYVLDTFRNGLRCIQDDSKVAQKFVFLCLALAVVALFLLLAVLEMMCFRLCFVLLSMLSMPLHGWQSVSELFSYLAICLIVGHIMTILRARASITKHAKRRY